MDQRGQTSLLTAKFSESSLQPLEAEVRYHNVTTSETTERGCQDSCESSTIHDSDRSEDIYGSYCDVGSSDSPLSSGTATWRSRSRSASCFDTDFSRLMNDPDCDYSSSLSDGLSRCSSSSSETIEERQVHEPVHSARSSSVYSLATEVLARELGQALEEERTPPPNPVSSGLIRLSAPRHAQQPIAFPCLPPLPSLPLFSAGPGPAGRLVLPHPGGGGSRRCIPRLQSPPPLFENSPGPPGQQPPPLIPRRPDDLGYDADVETSRARDRLDRELFGHTPRSESSRSVRARSTTSLHSPRAPSIKSLHSDRSQSITPRRSTRARSTTSLHSPRARSVTSLQPESTSLYSQRARSVIPLQSERGRITPSPPERARSITPPPLPPSKKAWSPLPPLAVINRRSRVGGIRPLPPRWHLQRPSAKRQPVTPPPDSDENDEDEDEDEDDDENDDGEEGAVVEYSPSEYIPDSASHSDSENMSTESDVSSDASGTRPNKRRKKK